MHHCLLPDRGIIAVGGADAEALLNRLFTNSVIDMASDEARYAALLSPQGKLLYDFFVVHRPDGFWIECRRDQATEIAKKLTLFRLRAKATITDCSSHLSVAAAWGATKAAVPGVSYRDPRHDGLGIRIVAPPDELKSVEGPMEAYKLHRINLGIPEGGVDWAYGDTFVHDANLDLLHGVDFQKGCYVGQEVVSRVHHRNSARKRVVKVQFYGNPVPSGTSLVAGTLQIGEITSSASVGALATARIDRLAEASAANVPVLAGETLVGITLPTKATETAQIHAETGA